jgi:trk system potassium uptake protein TrkA
MQNKKFLVIGLGRFGSALAKSLIKQKCEVFGVDENQRLVDEYSNQLTQTRKLDVTDEEALKEISPEKYDVAIIAIGSNVQASVFAAVLLKEKKVKCVVAKALTDNHGILLQKVGVDKIVFPEREAGERLANQLVSPNLLDLIELSEQYRLAEINVPKKLDGFTLARLNPNGKYNVNIVAINRSDDTSKLIVAPKADVAVREHDRIVVIGEGSNIERFEREVIDKD